MSLRPCFLPSTSRSPFRTLLQQGFSLVELIIATALISILLTVLGYSLSSSTDRYKADMILAQMDMLKTGLLRFQVDFPCGTNYVSALTNPNDAEIGACGDTNPSERWAGPYIDPSSHLGGVGNAALDIGNTYSGALLYIGSVATATPSVRTFGVVLVDAPDIASAVLEKCGPQCMTPPGFSGSLGTATVMLTVGSVPIQDSTGYTDEAFQIKPLADGQFVRQAPALPSTP